MTSVVWIWGLLLYMYIYNKLNYYISVSYVYMYRGRAVFTSSLLENSVVVEKRRFVDFSTEKCVEKKIFREVRDGKLAVYICLPR